MNQPLDGWPAPGADGISVRLLDVGAKATLRGRRVRRALTCNTRVINGWPAAWRDLLASWLDGAQKRRWDTLLAAAGNAGYNIAHELLDSLLRAGLIETTETRERGQWRVLHVSFLDARALRETLGIPDVAALRAALEKALATPPGDTRLASLWEELAGHPPARGLERASLLHKLDEWVTQNLYGTRRDFALFARGATKAITASEWKWLTALPDFGDFGIERHTPALWLRAPLRLLAASKVMDLAAVPDALGLTPQTIRGFDTAEGRILCWRVVENRTSFERVAREYGAHDGVVWLPGFAPGWWRDGMRKLIGLAPAPGHFACDPDPSGIHIALDAGSVWDEQGLSWCPWRMSVDELLGMGTRVPLSAHDRLLLNRLTALNLPEDLHALALWMLAHGEKGEQEGYL